MFKRLLVFLLIWITPPWVARFMDNARARRTKELADRTDFQKYKYWSRPGPWDRYDRSS